ncbi:AAA family ATPase [Flavobacterium sp.]|uniref:AAA family ATPase n=1 Tax=Flavobacterium sp. TaxID=239 RepID=UPI002BD028E6|nr:AAA family ATPase [Flavobacterium sp.]HSD06516.1 AAA family ATPase [Flavobacterium sp.]
MSTENTHSQEKSLKTQPIKDTKFKDTKGLIDAIDTSLNSAHSEKLAEESHVLNRLKFKINLKEKIVPPKIAWSLCRTKNQGEDILGTMGNFGLIIGKAKSKKTFFTSIAVATASNNNHSLLNRFKSYLPSNKNEVLYIDTEQGKYHVQNAVKRICKLINIEEPVNLHAFHLRSLSPAERLQFIESEIYLNDKIGFVVIDGIKDLVTSINDEGEATMITTKLLKWTEERDLYILTVLHQNKGDNNARGHIGTELINKAEIVLSVTALENDKEISIVEAQQCRNREPETFAFKIDEDGLPFLVSMDELPIKKTNNSRKETDLESHQKYQLLTEVYSHEKEFKYGQLLLQIKLAYTNQFEKNLADNRIKGLITECSNKGWLIQAEKKGSYTLGEY